jgi:hypothetical protein
VKFICGRSIIEGDQLLGVLEHLTIHAFGEQDPPDLREGEEQIFIGFSTVWELDKIRKNHGGYNNPIFFDFVMLNRERFGREPVDKIYAALGMSVGTDEVYRKGISIDYSEDAKKNYWRLYAMFGKIALQHEPHLRLLSTVSSKDRLDHLPSWCPNLNSTRITKDLDSSNVYAAGWPWREHGSFDDSKVLRSPPCTGHPNFKGEFESHVSIVPNSDTISIWGASLGRIKAIGFPCKWNADVNIGSLSSVQPFAAEFLKWFFENEKFCKTHCKDEKTAIHVHEQVLLGATSDERRVNKMTRQELFEALGLPISKPNEHSKNVVLSNNSSTIGKLESTKVPGKSKELETTKISSHETEVTEDQNSAEYKTGKSSRNNNNMEKTYGRSLATKFIIITLFDILQLKDENWQDQHSKLLEDFEMAYSNIIGLSNSWTHRIQFVTENGHFGRASADLKVGDNVCMLYGGRSLFILRQETKGYSFVSDAYVLNCVNGELFEMLDESLVKEELLSIS